MGNIKSCLLFCLLTCHCPSTPFPEPVSSSQSVSLSSFGDIPHSESTSTVTISTPSPHQDHHPFPTIHVTCIACSIDSIKYPSVFLYEADHPQNPTVAEGMCLRLWGEEDSSCQLRKVHSGILDKHSITTSAYAADYTELERYIAGIRGIDQNHVEFWVMGTSANISCFAYLIVPTSRVKLSRAQVRLHTFIKRWIPQTIDNSLLFEEMCKVANELKAQAKGKAPMKPATLIIKSSKPVTGPPPFWKDPM